MVLSCFSWNGVGSIHLISETMTKVYKIILEDVMLSVASEEMPLCWVFQQDNNPKHSSRLVSSWFHENNTRFLCGQAGSPDLNPIENLWWDLKCPLRRENIRNKTELCQKVQGKWYNTPVRCRFNAHRKHFSVLKNKIGHNVLCVDFTHEWRDLQFKINSE